jgi:hypothetical protein
MITKLKIFKENNILVPRNLEGREEKFIQQQARLFQQEIIEGNVTINKDFYLNFTNVKTKKIIGDVSININKIPLWFKDIEIDGSFFCDTRNLTTLEGSPQIVNGNFSCSYNKLTTLEGCPQIVNSSFYCSSNNLTTLEYCPKYVGISFWCRNNKVQFTEEDVKKLCQVKGNILI